MKTLGLFLATVFALSTAALAAPTPKQLAAQPRVPHAETRQVTQTADLRRALFLSGASSVTTFAIFGPNNKCVGGNGAVCECSGSCEANATACRCL